MSDGYSARFQAINSGLKDHIKQIHQNERIDMIARSKKLQQETNRRRKALVIKRKLENQREEKRRQEILNKRREQQRSATEKYQRLNRTYAPVSPRAASPHSHSTTPLLEEALRAVRGGGTGGHVRRGTHDGSVSQGSAASSRAGSATQATRGRIGSASSAGGGSAVSVQSQQSATTDNLNRNYYTGYNPPATAALNARTAEHARQVAAHTELQSSSLRNLTNSRSRFEAQLEQHQQHLAEHQRQALNQFNAAIRQDIDADTTLHGTSDLEPEITRSESLSSVDSLEDGDSPDGKSTPVGPINNPRSQVVSNILTEKAGSDSGVYQKEQKPVSGLHTSHSEDSLANYAAAIGQGQPSQYAGGLASNMTTAVTRHGLTTNIPPGSGFVLHRSLSSGANVAVVQPISSSNNQTPNSTFGNHLQKPPVSKSQYTAGNNTSSPLVISNGYHGQVQGDGGKQHSAAPGGGGVYSSVQGKEGALIGPLCSSQAARGQYFADQVVNHVSQASNNHFYLGNYNGTNYTGEVVSGDAQRQVTNDDFHARTKAWASPSPNVTSAFTATNQGVVSGDGMGANLTTNIKPHSSRLTATNTTLTTDSSAAGGAVAATNIQPGNNATQDNNTSLQNAALANAGQAGFQAGTVYSKASIPSTMIVSNPASRVTYQQNANSAVGTTPAATAMTTESASRIPVPTPLSHNQKEEPEELSDGEGEGDEEVEDEEQERIIKGILKQTYNPNQVNNSRGRGRGVPVKGYTAQLQSRSRGRGQPPPQPGARDSLEVTRDNLGQRPAKKSVRFAEKLVEEQELQIVPEPTPETTSNFVKPSVRQEKTAVKVRGKPPRPVSARVASSTPKVEVSVRESRSASAGTLRRRPFVRQGAPRVTVSKQGASTGQAVNHGQGATNGQDQASAAGTHAHSGTGSTVPTPQKSLGDPVYDGNGLRLDRTPTDDEINWLWDKVRTCLSRTSTTGSQDSQSQTTDQSSVAGRQPANMSSKYIDGNTLAPQYRTVTRVQQNTNSMAIGREPTINTNGTYQGTGRKKVTMDHLNSYGRKNSGLLSQRKSTSQAPATTTQPTTQATNYTTYKPIYSTQGPAAVTGNNQNGDVTDSMAAFLTAEALAQQSVSESQIEHAMDDASHRQQQFNTAKPYYKAPSAISMEEQRLLQSLERLNERLKSHVKACRQSPVFPTYSPRFLAAPGSADTREVYVYQNWTEGQQTVSGYRRLTETSVVGGGNHTGRTPPYSSGFRGHQPLTGTTQRRQHSAGGATSGSTSRAQFRVSSAGNIHKNHGGHVYYH